MVYDICDMYTLYMYNYRDSMVVLVRKVGMSSNHDMVSLSDASLNQNDMENPWLCVNMVALRCHQTWLAGKPPMKWRF